jgi:RIO kinase 2
MGMKNHELVNGKLVAMIAQLGSGGAHKILMRLSKERLVAYERGKHCKYNSSISIYNISLFY